MNINFNNKLAMVAEKANIEIAPSELEKFNIYFSMLIDWNENINLTAITDMNGVIEKHFVDSLLISKVFSIDNISNIIDIGTGAGFPGVPLKIMYNHLDVVLLDSLRKRLNFLDHVILKLGLENISCVHARVEQLGKDKIYREKFELVVSRAVAYLPVLLEYSLPMVKENCHFISYKGAEVDQELADSNRALKELGGEVIDIKKFKLPESGDTRSLVIIKKIKETPLKYPRKPGIPAKKPII